MKRVWKIGTRWGNTGPSNLDLFLNYQCAFFGLEGSGYGDYTKAQAGDLLLVCSGATPVAIGLMKSGFCEYSNSGINFCETDRKEWIDPYDVVLCKAQFWTIPEEDVHGPWGNDPRKRFCSHSTIEIVNDKWEKYSNDSSNGTFDIKTRTVGLLPSPKEAGVFSDKVRYRVPVYQRPYSWGERELRRLLEDLKEGVANSEPMFLGTMQLSAPIPLGDSGYVVYDIIDGQQRTTTLLLLRCLLEERLDKAPAMDGRDNKYITHVNRGAAQRDLDSFWQVWRERKLVTCNSESATANQYLSNIALLNNLLDDYFLGSEEGKSNVGLKELLDFIETKLRFVVIETHAGISKTLKIFNTINTTGLDLGAEDLFKIRFYEYRKDVGKDADDIFDKISLVYERVADAQKDTERKLPYSMSSVLDVYKKVLIATHHLRNDLDSLSTSLFFERLFDSMLHVRSWPEFRDVALDMNVEDLNRIVDSFEVVSKAFSNDESLYIMHHFLGATRYGYVWNYLIVALYFNSINEGEMLDFETILFKLLVPPSLHWAKRVYSVQGSLLDILRELPQNNGLVVLKRYLENPNGLDNINAHKSFSDACEYPITGYVKWKNLLCRLCEYLLAKDQGKEQSLKHLFFDSIDIEHIQSYTDRNDPDSVWQTWGQELNRLGNLVMLESSVNRSIGNDETRKPDAYSESVYVSVKNLSSEVREWNLDKAKERRAQLTERMRKFLFTA